MRLARTDDVPRVIDEIGAAFFAESGFAAFAEFDPCRWLLNATAQITKGSPFVIAERSDGEILGFASYTLEQSFTKRPIACLWMFYIYPAWRGTQVARALLFSILDLAKHDECCAFFATIFPGNRGGKALCNLFRTAGFGPQGGAFWRAL
jgi:L-amino acid N-acyltransferase YncA